MFIYTLGEIVGLIWMGLVILFCAFFFAWARFYNWRHYRKMKRQHKDD